MAENPHILVVDDDARLRGLLKDFLSGKGYRVTAAPSAAAARKVMDGLSFDAIVLDVMMPGETGLAFVERLRGEVGQISGPQGGGAFEHSFNSLNG